ncbi:hypothetical protein OC835_001493 [Tilletia horrida]|uniref:Isochorismatase-like domain-containing protein n=1 Tax=Tilletia horrida TaxID=155126 RepID=A0AAN6GJU8_9BASI|nr:hypothetical protein OC835_001493 [Tilletia horrida]KAK0541146.1 hypothetical protein OC842_000105 [Tilletia horrida]KAK0565797.1 hypothetical protein OC844_001059 [Tilletia horrida]
MTPSSSSKTALLFIDIQENMLTTPGSWWVPEPLQTSFLAHAAAVLERARAARIPIYHVQHHSVDPDEVDAYGSPGWALRFPPDDASSDEVVKHKTVQNVFESNPGLADELRARGVGRVLTCGLQSELCVKQGSLGALREGFAVVLLSGAHATLEEEGGKRATEIMKEVEDELAQAGVEVIAFDADWKL